VLNGAEDFYLFGHQKVFQAMLEIQGAGKPVDPLTVATWLKDNRFIDDVGGYPYLLELWESTKTPQNGASYAATVRECALLRGLIHASNETIAEVDSRCDLANNLAERAEQRFFELATLKQAKTARHISELATEAGLRMDERRKRDKRNGFATGWADLDRWFIGLKPGQITIVGARTSVGKTVFGLNLAWNLASRMIPTCFFSLEMNEEEVTDRLICSVAQMDGKAFQEFIDDTEYLKAIDAVRSIMGATLHVNDDPDQSVMQMSSEGRRMKARGQLSVAIIDYLQLIRPEIKAKDRREQVDHISRRLKLMARQLQIPVVCLCQVGREAEKAEEPQLHHLRESGAIEQDADNVFLLHRPGQDDEKDRETMEVRIAKQRNGPKKKICLDYIKPQFRLYDMPTPGGYA
jgi:replicative DNA helicase